MNYTIQKSVRFVWRGVECVVEFKYRDYNHPDMKWNPRLESYSAWRRSQEKKARLYYSEKGVMQSVIGDSPAYTIKGQDAGVDAAWRKYNRTESELARAAIEAAFPQFGKSSFSRYAGCSCPCSPGFISQVLRGGEGWIDVRLAAAENAA